MFCKEKSNKFDNCGFLQYLQTLQTWPSNIISLLSTRKMFAIDISIRCIIPYPEFRFYLCVVSWTFWENPNKNTFTNLSKQPIINSNPHFKQFIHCWWSYSIISFPLTWNLPSINLVLLTEDLVVIWAFNCVKSTKLVICCCTNYPPWFTV